MARSGDPNWTPYFDTHFHPEFLFPKEQQAKNLKKKTPWKLEILENKHPYPFPNGFLGGMSIWCHPNFHDRVRTMVDADQRIYAAVGCHPHFARLYDLRREVLITEILDSSPQCVAWGEMGLDYNRQGGRSPDPRQQRSAFKSQLRAAVRRDLPIVIHGRDAAKDLMKIMSRSVPHAYPNIHLHCITLPPSGIAQFKDRFINAKFGFTNKITRHSPEGRGIRETVRSLPLHKILTETDAPWHLPAGWRPPTVTSWRIKQRCFSHPGMVDAVVRAIASEKNLPVHEVAQATYHNACVIYRL